MLNLGCGLTNSLQFMKATSVFLYKLPISCAVLTIKTSDVEQQRARLCHLNRCRHLFSKVM